MTDFRIRWKQAVVESGLAAVGIIPANPPKTWSHYRYIIAHGVAPELGYLTTHLALKKDYEAILPGTRYIICCVAVLPTWPEQMPCKYARFCAIGDYHAVMRERMASIWRVLAPYYPDANVRYCVDSAPVLERELSVRAGLGGIGFNHLMIHPELGSFVILGEIFVDVDLRNMAEMLPIRDDGDRFDGELLVPGGVNCCRPGERCCVRACPTGALSEDGYDFNRCLAYWTTQHKGEIPEFYAKAMGDVVWGCDRCQMGCPRNKRAANAGVSVSPLISLSMNEILSLSARQLGKRLSGTPIADAHPYLLQRNVCIVIGNTGDARYVEELVKIVENHPSEWVRGAAMRALRCLHVSGENVLCRV